MIVGKSLFYLSTNRPVLWLGFFKKVWFFQFFDFFCWFAF